MGAHSENLIELRSLTKTYGQGRGQVNALQDISLTVRRNDFLALMGPSGSGKSSLLAIMGLLDAPTSGTLNFAGEDVTSISSDRASQLRNRHIGYVLQSYHLLVRRTALANVELPLMYRGASRLERRRRAMSALGWVGLEDRAGALPSELSGGEQQRVAIARALVGKPDLILADEPTGALDSRSGEMVLRLLKQIHENHCAVVLVTHDAKIAAGANRLMLLADGHVHYDGPVANPDHEPG